MNMPTPPKVLLNDLQVAQHRLILDCTENLSIGPMALSFSAPNRERRVSI
jgi:hypothetical protein